MMAALARFRDALATGLLALGATPNALTLAGFGLTCVAVAFLFAGAGARPATEQVSWHPVGAAVVLTVAFALDILDGAVARLGGLKTDFGAILDSTLDRLSDFVLFAACALHFAGRNHLTLAVLSLSALGAAFTISYVKARTECLAGGCGVGFWQRGERCALFLFALYCGRLPAAIWLLGTLPFLTVIRRLRQAHRLVAETGAPPDAADSWAAVLPWRRPRGSLGFCICVAACVAWMVGAALVHPVFSGAADPLRACLAGGAG